MIRLLACVAVLLWALTAPAAIKSFDGRVVVPKGVDPTALELTLHEGIYSEVENDPLDRPLAVRPDPKGHFSLSTTSDTLKLSLEFAGPGVRRARFPWPEPGEARAVFRLNPGVTTTLRLVDRETSGPIANALIGPIFPSEEAENDQVESTFPFFVRGDASGEVVISGLIPNTPYGMPVQADGYMRRKVIVPAGSSSRVDLDRGGSTVEGILVGNRTQQPWPNEVVQVVSANGTNYFLHRTDASARFRITGLPPGDWRFTPFILSLGDMRATEVTLLPNRPLRGLAVEVNEGIDVEVLVSDVETGLPIPGATLTSGPHSAETDRLGRAQFNRLTGPWPVRFDITAPNYEYLDADQRDVRYPINGYDSGDLSGVAIALRRVRFLEVLLPAELVDSEGNFLPATVELYERAVENPGPPTLHRVHQPSTVVRLAGAGRRQALVRRHDGFASDLIDLRTAQEDTTTTLATTLELGATLAGSLTFTEGPPAPSFRLQLRAMVDAEPYDFATISPDSEGSFVMDALPPGRFLARFLRADNSPMLEEEVELVRGGVTELDRTISRGQILAGQVVSPDGVPQREIPIRAWGRDPQGNPLQRLVMSAEEGKFRLEGFGGGTIDEIRIEHHQWKPMVLPGVLIPQEDFKITLEPRTGITVRAQADSGALRVARAVVLSGAQRSDELAVGQWYFTPAEQESFGGNATIFLAPQTEGSIQIAVEADGLWDVSKPMMWTAKSPSTEVSLTPRHNASLAVTVEGANPEDLRSAVVTLINTSLPEGRVVTSFTPTVRPPNVLYFDKLPAGQYLLLITSADGDSISKPNLFIAGGAQELLTVSLKPSLFRVAGIVLDAAERGVAEAEVRLMYGDLPEPPVLDSMTTEKGGVFEFVAVPGGRPLLLEARLGDSRARQMLQPLTEDAPAVELRFPKKVKVTFDLPPRVADRSRQNPVVPFIVTSVIGGEGLSFNGEEVSGTFEMWAGDYIVSWGEDSLGPVSISEKGGKIPLPDLPERR